MQNFSAVSHTVCAHVGGPKNWEARENEREEDVERTFIYHLQTEREREREERERDRQAGRQADRQTDTDMPYVP